MLVQTHHFSIVIEALPNETQTDFNALCLLVRKALDAQPDRIHHLDDVVAELRRYVAYHERDCVPDLEYTLFQ